MKVVYHPDYNAVYTSDPASAAGRIQAIVDELLGKVIFVTPQPAAPEDILRVHSPEHILSVEREGVYPLAALAAGVQAVRITNLAGFAQGGTVIKE